MTDTDKSLLKCTIKKSVDVTKKLVLYAAYAVCAVTAVALAAFGAVGVGSALAAPVITIGSIVTTFLLSIPWYVYVGILAIAAIPAYSFAWCVAREITEEDKAKDDASNDFIFRIVTLFVAVGFQLLSATIVPSNNSMFVVFCLVIPIVIAVSGIFGLPVVQYYIATYRNYRRRVRGGA